MKSIVRYDFSNAVSAKILASRIFSYSTLKNVKRALASIKDKDYRNKAKIYKITVEEVEG